MCVRPRFIPERDAGNFPQCPVRLVNPRNQTLLNFAQGRKSSQQRTCRDSICQAPSICQRSSVVYEAVCQQSGRTYIGLASATSHLDQNAGNVIKMQANAGNLYLVLNKLGVISSLYWTTPRKHSCRRIEHQPGFHFAEQLQPGFSCLLSLGSDSVLYSKFLCYVSGSSSRIAHCSTSPALLPWRRPLKAKHLVSLGCSLCFGLFIAHSCWSLDRENARNNEMKTSSSCFDVEWFPCSLVHGQISAPVDRCLHDGNSPILHTNLAQPPLSVQLVSKLSKSCQNFLKPPCEGKRTLTSERPVSQHAFVWDAIFV